ncbi:restriction endonuclease subunit S [Hoylesella marshii]|uniref:Type I restriction modification DNA specificity domain protein n=1 Tax=Hoylesella marshii DSM 16973 = JCM 13450 TaxID=862515 RepID=E0NSG8_9BACT|nr:restriction endonuclease subunit S [Hoylesella marshii]EFM01920.1 type I restriction modification DNA specificity domain protein [Hoylesella marshii DSM 16973 = JCM 13450]
MDTKKLRQKILDLAIHGKLVPQDPNDEPASVLLERIRAEKERLISEGKIKRSRKTLNTTDTHHYEQDVPNGWCKTALSEIITLLSGRDLQPTQYNSFEKGIPYITGASNIDNNTIIINRWTTAPITISHKGDLLITCKGTIGKLAFNSVGDLHIARQFMSLQFIEPLVSKYLFYCLEERISAIKQMDNGLIPGIDRSIILNQIIQLPPLAEQYRIVAEIERWFALIDTIEKSKEGLETAIKQTKSKILDLAIHGKLVPQDPKDEPASEQLRRINPKAKITCDNGHYAQLPREWSVISMQDVCKLKDGIKLDSTPLINLDVKYLRGTSAGKVIDSGKFVTANSYMILVDGENSGEVFKTPIDGYQGSTFKLLDIDQNIDEKYILNVINLHRKALRENKVGSAIPHLNKKLFKAISVPLPPYNEQVRIVEAIKSTFNLLDALKENL